MKRVEPNSPNHIIYREITTGPKLENTKLSTTPQHINKEDNETHKEESRKAQSRQRPTSVNVV